MMELGNNYSLIETVYNHEENNMRLKISNIVLELSKKKSSLWKNEWVYYITLYTLNLDKVIEIPMSLDNADVLYQYIMYLYIHCKPFSIDIPDVQNRINYNIIGYCADDDMVLEFNFNKIDFIKANSITYTFNLNMDYVEDFTEKYFFFFLVDLYSWDWYGDKV